MVAILQTRQHAQPALPLIRIVLLARTRVLATLANQTIIWQMRPLVLLAQPSTLTVPHAQFPLSALHVTQDTYLLEGLAF